MIKKTKKVIIHILHILLRKAKVKAEKDLKKKKIKVINQVKRAKAEKVQMKKKVNINKLFIYFDLIY